MKRTPLQRKTPLTAKKPLRSSKRPLRAKKATKTTKRTRKKKSELQKLKIKLWELCKNIIRTKYGNTCYTCGKQGLEGSNWHTGHFISSSICSTELHYDLNNLRPQCYNCNINKSGNWLAYEQNLLKDKIDIQELKDKNEATKGQMYREDWYKEKIEEYKNILNNL